MRSQERIRIPPTSLLSAPSGILPSMALPAPRILATTHGYYPDVRVVGDLLKSGMFDDFLVLGVPVPDANGDAAVRVIAEPEVELPQGVYWFSVDPPVAMVVHLGSEPAEPLHQPADAVEPGSVLDAALGWVDALWDKANPVPDPLFPVGDAVLVRSTGQDALIRARRFTNGRWSYDIRTGDADSTRLEADLDNLPSGSSPHEWLSRVDRPGSGGGCDLPRRMESCLHRGSIPMSCASEL